MKKEIVNTNNEKKTIIQNYNSVTYETKIKKVRRKEGMSSRVRKLGKRT